MASSLFNRYGNVGGTYGNSNQNRPNNIKSQLIQLKNDPGQILDILLQNGKINQQQYFDLQRYRNNPEAICRYLINNGRGNEISQAEQLANQKK